MKCAMLPCVLTLLAAGGLLAADELRYEDFGAVGDGVTDDRAAIVKTHAEANSRGVRVRATDGKTYYVGGGDAPAIVQTDVDFGTAKIVIDDTKVKSRFSPLFRLKPTVPGFAVKDVRRLKRGQAEVGRAFETPCLLHVVNDKVRRYIRWGLNQNDGSAQQETLLVDAAGRIDPAAPLIWDYDRISKMTAFPMDAKTLVVKGGVFVTVANQDESKYTYYNRGFLVERSNVRFENLRHEVTGEKEHGAPYGAFVSVSQCANVLIRDCVFTAHKTYVTVGSAGKPVSMGSYDLAANNAINVTFLNCRQTTDIMDRDYWGIFGSNYSKNLVYDGCTFSRFDAHMGVANATIRNSTLGYMGINAIGFGTLTVENSTVFCGNFVNLRTDYGSTWDGEFVIRNCRFVPQRGARASVPNLVGGSYTGKHDFGYVCHMPRRILVDGLQIDDTNHPAKYDGPTVFGLFNKDRRDASYVEDYPYVLTEEVVLRNVRTSSGKPLSIGPNAYMFKDVKVVRQP